MRRAVTWVTVFLGLWGLWWAAASVLMHQGTLGLLGALRDDGWQVRAEVDQTGFPLRLQTVMSDVSLESAAQELVVAADHLTVRAPVYWPGYLSVDLPETPMMLNVPGQEIRLRVTDATAGLRLRPGLALALQGVTATSGAWLLSTPQGAVVSGVRLDLSFAQTATPDTYALRISADDLTPGEMLRGLLALPSDWPRSFDAFAGRLVVDFDVPLDRHALQGPPPQPRMIDLQELEVRWGTLHLSGAGRLLMDARGVPSGEVRFGLMNWQQVLDIAAKSGLLDGPLRNRAQMVMGGLANLGGGGPDLDLTLAFEDGQTMLGPIRLGPAPRIMLR